MDCYYHLMMNRNLFVTDSKLDRYSKKCEEAKN